MINLYSNQKDILDLNVNYGQTYSDKDFVVFEPTEIPEWDSVNDVKYHLYDIDGNYVTSSLPYWKFGVEDRQIKINPEQEIRNLGLDQGKYLYSYTFNQKVSLRELVVTEIDVARRWVKVEAATNRDRTFDVGFDYDTYGLYSLDFGRNLIYPTPVLQKQQTYLTGTTTLVTKSVYFHFITEVDSSIDIGTKVTLVKEISYPYFDAIELIPSAKVSNKRVLTPNFGINIQSSYAESTALKTWDDLLGTNTSNSERIISDYISSSLGPVVLNTNYSDFNEFIHFSSAEERVRNFYYKLGLIQTYNTDITTLGTVSGSSALSSITELTNKKNNLIGSFDGFEKFLYYESTGSYQRFTYDTGSFEPWPKTSDNPITLHHTTSSVALSYYNELLNKAVWYDENNIHALINSVPFHVKESKYNENYLDFVYMIGQYFDYIFMYIKHLTSKNQREDHPFSGISKDLLYEVASSMGWELDHGFQNDDLWKYLFGLNDSGTLLHSGSLRTKSTDSVMKEKWRRIINNLPLFYKTKGTARSVKAMFSCYGIPNSLLSIKEYGGPTVNNVKPEYEYERFSYALENGNNRYIKTRWSYLTDKNGSLQMPSMVELRFKPADELTLKYTNGYRYTLFQSGLGASTNWYVELEKTGSKSQRANVHFYLNGDLGWYTASVLDQKLLDNKFAYVSVTRLVNNDTGSINNEYTLRVKKFDDGLKTVDESSTLVINGSAHADSASYNQSWSTEGFFYAGNNDTPSPNSNYFTGSFQELRFWVNGLSNDTQTEHARSPLSYHGDTYTSSFDDLKFRLPLNYYLTLSATSSVSSTHPNQKLNLFSGSHALTGSLIGYSNSDLESIEETYVTTIPSIGGNNVNTNKVRIETNSVSGLLSPYASLQTSSFDTAPLDSPKLGIYFSPTSVIDEDIVYQSGYFDMGDYIGDPRDQLRSEYRGLEELKYNYFRKYQSKFDVTTYLNLIKQYDMSVFKQIKKLVPARAKLSIGVLMQPTLVSRTKARTHRSITKTQPYYTASIGNIVSAVSGEMLGYTCSISTSPYAASVYNLTEVKLDSSGDYQVLDLPQDVTNPFGLFISSSRPSYSHLQLRPIYATKDDAINQRVSYSIESPAERQDYRPQGLENSFYAGSRMSSPDFNSPSRDTIDGKAVIEVFNVSGNKIVYKKEDGLEGNLKVE